MVGTVPTYLPGDTAQMYAAHSHDGRVRYEGLAAQDVLDDLIASRPQDDRHVDRVGDDIVLALGDEILVITSGGQDRASIIFQSL